MLLYLLCIRDSILGVEERRLFGLINVYYFRLRVMVASLTHFTIPLAINFTSSEPRMLFLLRIPNNMQKLTGGTINAINRSFITGD